MNNDLKQKAGCNIHQLTKFDDHMLKSMKDLIKKLLLINIKNKSL